MQELTQWGAHPSLASAAIRLGIDVESAGGQALAGGNLQIFRRRGDG